jgi:2-polyprenyl-6-methoxyphenol hydroxylase-like FAD-dependent oxidoreductase
MADFETTEVLIVGAGPAGLTLALSLAKFHIRVRHSAMANLLDAANPLHSPLSSRRSWK